MKDFNNILYAKIGEKLVALRKADKLTQEKLSEKVGVKRATISNIEAGRQQITVHLLYKFAQALHTEVAAFLPSNEELSLKDPDDESQLRNLLEQKDAGDITKNSILKTIKDSNNDS